MLYEDWKNKLIDKNNFGLFKYVVVIKRLRKFFLIFV